MKEKVLTLIIGILIGAVITAGCFLIFGKNNASNQGKMGNPPTMSGNQIGGPRGQGGPDGQGTSTSGTNNGTTTTTNSNTTTE